MHFINAQTKAKEAAQAAQAAGNRPLALLAEAIAALAHAHANENALLHTHLDDLQTSIDRLKKS